MKARRTSRAGRIARPHRRRLYQSWPDLRDGRDRRNQRRPNRVDDPRLLPLRVARIIE
jgi:hypothetical protein